MKQSVNKCRYSSLSLLLYVIIQNAAYCDTFYLTQQYRNNERLL